MLLIVLKDAVHESWVCFITSSHRVALHLRAKFMCIPTTTCPMDVSPLTPDHQIFLQEQHRPLTTWREPFLGCGLLHAHCPPGSWSSPGPTPQGSQYACGHRSPCPSGLQPSVQVLWFCSNSVNSKEINWSMYVKRVFSPECPNCELF